MILTSFDWKVGTSWLNYMLPASRSKDKPSPNIFFQITFHCEMISVDKWFRLSSSKCWSQLTCNFSYPHPNVHLVWLILSNSQPGLDNYNNNNDDYNNDCNNNYDYDNDYDNSYNDNYTNSCNLSAWSASRWWALFARITQDSSWTRKPLLESKSPPDQ